MPQPGRWSLSRGRENLLALLWCLLLAGLTVLKTAPQALNADILLNTVMALQKPATLYYWGQNRLLNVLPWVLSPVRSPTWNLALVLMLTSLCFYGLLHALARTAQRWWRPEASTPVALQGLVFLSLVCVLGFQPWALAGLVIGHIEYSLSALWLLWALNSGLSRPLRGPDAWRDHGLTLLWLVLAIGLNPSALLPVGAVALLAMGWRGGWRAPREWALLAVSLAIFLGWTWVASHFDRQRYSEFRLDILQQGLPAVLSGLWRTQDPWGLLPCAALVLCAGAMLWRWPPGATQRRRLVFVAAGVLAFAGAWVLLFSASEWVQMNQFSWRYFAYPMLAGLFALAVLAVASLSRLAPETAWGVSGLAALAVLACLAAPWRGFADYRVFRQVNAVSPVGGQLYAGDYWLAWPSVLRDMMAGHEAYGLLYRGGANAAQARAHVARTLQRQGQVSVHCLNDRPQRCEADVQGLVGPLRLRETLIRGTAWQELVFVASPG